MLKSISKYASFMGCALALSGCLSTPDTATRNIVSSSGGVPVPYTENMRLSNFAGPTRAYVTGYSYWDNTPARSAAIARPVIHRKAGGTGTYSDPVTVAVGHVKRGGRSKMDFPAGTRFYFPDLQKYGIVEDLCGDGHSPQNGPCHSGYRGYAWLDIYVGGKHVSAATADRCMRSITGLQPVILNPSPGLPVHVGEIAMSNCRAS